MTERFEAAEAILYAHPEIAERWATDELNARDEESSGCEEDCHHCYLQQFIGAETIPASEYVPQSDAEIVREMVRKAQESKS